MDPSECCIKVVCRVRPLNNAEKERGDSCVLNVPSDEQITLAVIPSYSKITMRINCSRTKFEAIIVDPFF